MGSQLWTPEFRRFLAKARKEACRLGNSSTMEIHFLLVSVADEGEPTSRILREMLGERAFCFLKDRLEELGRGRAEPVKRSYRNARWYSAVRLAESEDNLYKIGRIYPEHFLLGYLRSDDWFFLRGFLDFCNGTSLIHRLRVRLEQSLRERVSS